MEGEFGMIFDVFRRRPDGRAIPMPDQSISVRDAARVMAEQAQRRAVDRSERQRANVRAKCRELCALAGKPVPAALRD